MAGTGPKSFSVRTKKGHILELGNSGDSRISPTGLKEVRTWHLNSVTDLNGNSLVVTYTSDPLNTGESDKRAYPIQISYTSNDSQRVAANRFVRFRYEPRDDVEVHYVGGKPIRTSARLTSIQTLVGRTSVSDYRLKYEYSKSTGRSRLVAVQRFESPKNSASSITPELFSWQDGGRRFNDAAVWSATDFTKVKGWDGSIHPFTLADVNGDGISDVVGFQKGTQVALGKTDRFQPATLWINEFSNENGWSVGQRRLLSDVNGDGLADVVAFDTTGFKVALSNGAKFQKPKSYPYFGQVNGWNSSTPIFLQDVNGDHLMDVIGFKDDVQVSLGSSGGFLKPVQWSSGFGNTSGWLGTQRLLADMNGDGLADVVGMRKSNVEVALSTGTSFDSKGWDQSFNRFCDPTIWGSAQTPRMLSDVNGDGLADIVGFRKGVQVALSNGTGFEPMVKWNDDFSGSTWSSGKPRMMTDVNGDGMADVVGVSDTSVQVALSTGGSFATANWDQNSLSGLGLIKGGSSSSNNRMVIDVNGDGLMDVIGFGNTSVSAGISSGASPDRITGVTKSTGARISIDYAPLSDTTVYTQTEPSALAHSQAYPPLSQNPGLPCYRSAVKLGGFYYVVKQYAVENNAAITENPFKYRYFKFYEDGLLDLHGRGWLGFRKVSTVSSESGQPSKQVTTEHNQVFPFVGRIASTTIYSATVPANILRPQLIAATGHVISTHRLTYAKVASAKPVTAGQNIWHVQKTNSRIDAFEKGTYAHSIGEAYGYDAFGNLSVSSKLNRVDQKSGKPVEPVNVLHRLTSYHNDTTNWQLGYPVYRKTSSQVDTKNIAVFKPKFDLSLQKLGYSPQQNLTSHGKWDQRNKAFLTKSFGYDEFGNPTRLTQPSGAIYTTDYETLYQTYKQSTTTPPNSASVRLVTHFGYDPRFGLRAIKIATNGRATIQCFDAFGRKTASQSSIPDDRPNTKGSPPSISPLATIQKARIPSSVVTLSKVERSFQNKIPIQLSNHLLEWSTAGPPKMGWTKRFIDGLGRIYKSTAQDEVKGEKILTNVSRNASHKEVTAVLPHYPGDTPSVVKQQFDNLGRRIRVSQPAGPKISSVTTVSYQETPTGVDVVQVRAVGEPYAIRQRFSFDYRANRKRLKSNTFPDGEVAAYQQDLLGRLTKITGPDGYYLVGISYDSVGRILRRYETAKGKLDYQ